MRRVRVRGLQIEINILYQAASPDPAIYKLKINVPL
jgi:hypothetical protein